jgi:hypothetical protein
MKNELRGQYFPDNYAVIAAVRKWVASASADFYDSTLLALVHRCRNYKSSFSGYVKLLEFHS